MKTTHIFQSLRECRDIVKGRPVVSSPGGVSYAELRHRIRMSYPPFRGERIRRSVLGAIASLVILATIFCAVAG